LVELLALGDLMVFLSIVLHPVLSLLNEEPHKIIFAALVNTAFFFKLIAYDTLGALLCQPSFGFNRLRSTAKMVMVWSFMATGIIVVITHFCTSDMWVESAVGIVFFLRGNIYLYATFRYSRVVKDSRSATFQRYGWFQTLDMFVGAIVFLGKHLTTEESNPWFVCEGHFPYMLIFGVLNQYVAYRALLRDTRYWLNDLNDDEWEQGNALNLSDIRGPLLGLTLEDGAGRILGRQFDKFEPRDVISHTELSLNMSQLIGHGGTSKVFNGMCQGEAVAIKLLFVPEICRSTIKTFFREAAFLRSLSSHPNIVKLRGICVAPPALCHVLELCDGSLQSLIMKRRDKAGTRLSRTMKCDALFLCLSLQCARAVAFLHSRKPPVIHRDIKSTNFLFTRRQSAGRGLTTRSGLLVKLADMDLALCSRGSDEKQSVYSTGPKYFSISSAISESQGGFCGTPQWASPETMRGECFGDMKSDVYSLLVVLWELLTLEIPYEGLDRRELNELVRRGDAHLPIPTGIPSELKQLFETGWSDNPCDRPSADTIVSVLTSLVEDDRAREREEMFNLGVLMFDPEHTRLRETRDVSGEGRNVRHCANGRDILKSLKYLKSSKAAQAYLGKTKELSKAAEALCQTFLDSGLLQPVTNSSIEGFMKTYLGEDRLGSKRNLAQKFSSDTYYQLDPFFTTKI